MPRGRTPQSVNAIRRAAFAVESLESRRMLTTLTGGQSFDYLAGDATTVIRVSLTGNITAEFIGMTVDEDTNATRLVDLISAPLPDDDAPEVGADIFSIYISESDSTGQISIAEIPEAGDPDRVATPFDGGTGDIRTLNNQTGLSQISEIDNAGAVWIGARTVDTPSADPEEDANPILFDPSRAAFGVRPRNLPLLAGIQTAVGVSVGKILIGGTVTGRVFIDGDIDFFYAGALLTGLSNGLIGTDAVPPILGNNFFVSGTINGLFVNTMVGTDGVGGNGVTNYRSGFDMKVGGKLGEFRVGGDYLGALEVVNNVETVQVTTAVKEFEIAGVSAGTAFFRGGLTGNAVASNDSRNDAQLLRSQLSARLQQDQVLEVQGTINQQDGDPVDSYGVSLIAGQKVTIRLQSLDPMSPARVGLFDPDGRLIRTDYSDFGEAGNAAFQFTADRPGTYTITAAHPGDVGFDGGTVGGPSPYRITVQNFGEVGLGGLHVTGNANFVEDGISALVRRGDLGALEADGTLFGGSTPIAVPRGNLRAILAGSLGFVNGGQPVAGTDLIVPRGVVGLVQTTAADGLLFLNPGGAANDEPDLSAAIGLDYQIISAANSFAGNVVAKRAIGTIRAGAFDFGGGVIAANADGIGTDGVIDLIDVAGQFGTAGAGGPAIYTGVGGNMRYLTVGGEIFRDALFGGGQPAAITPAVGAPVTLTDDSGADITFIPSAVATTGAGGVVTTTRGQLSVVSYGLRSGGSAIVRVSSTEGITLSSSGNAGSVEVGQVVVNGSASEVIYNPDTDRVQFDNPAVAGTPVGTNQQPQRALNVLAAGARKIDVWEVKAPITDTPTDGNISNLNNTTGGEVVNVNARSIGYLTGTILGYSRPTTAAAIIPRADAARFADSSFPFVDQRTGIRVGDPTVPDSGNIIRINTSEGLGNIHAVHVISDIVTNSDGQNKKGTWDGIYGAIVADRFNRVNIGEGILSAQSGAGGEAGLFAEFAPSNVPDIVNPSGVIGIVTGNQGADIRGTVAANRQIKSITLNGGSLIDAVVGEFNNLGSTSVLGGGASSDDVAQDALLNSTDTLAQPVYEVGPIQISNGGGIIGTLIFGADIAPITISNGFGMLNSSVLTNGADLFGGITTDGLGIRRVLIDGGAQTNQITANGTTGRLFDVTSFSPSVRQSAYTAFDPYTGKTIDTANDLHAFLGTSDKKKARKVSGVTNEGIIEDTLITGSRKLAGVQAFVIRSSDLRTPPSSSQFPMRISFANDIGKIKTFGGVEGLNVTSGGIEDFNTGGNVSYSNFTIAGAIDSFVAGRTIKGTTSITAGGPNGVISKLYAGRGFYANVSAAIGIGQVSIGSEIGSASFRSLGSIDSLSIGGSVLTGSYIRANKTIKNLFIGDDIEEGATLRARALTTQSIGGTVFGELVIGR